MTQPANADWQWSRWGSSSDEALAAAPAGSTAAEGRIVTTHTASGIQFDADLLFGEQGLRAVELRPADLAQCQLTLEVALGVYGQPTVSKNGETSLQQWRDEANGNLVYYWSDDTRSACSLTYEPLLRPNSLGGL